LVYSAEALQSLLQLLGEKACTIIIAIRTKYTALAGQSTRPDKFLMPGDENSLRFDFTFALLVEFLGKCKRL